jgi:hypothetical protein
MKKLIPLLIVFFLTNTAMADLSREQCLGRLDQALGAWRQGGQVWMARVEDDSAGGRIGNLYLQYPGKYLLDYDSGNDVLCDGKTVASYSGSKKINDYKFEEDPLWLLVQGEIGSTMGVEMVDQDSLGYYGENLRIVVADLVIIKDRSPDTRVRLYVTGEGKPEILAVGYPANEGFSKLWLRDFRQVTPAKDPFKRSVL